MVPDLDQRDLMMSQNYLIKRKNNNFDEDALIDRQEKFAYEKIYENISEKISPSFLIESFISEKSYDIENIKSQKKSFVDLKSELKIGKQENILQSTINKEKTKTVDMISQFISTYNLDNLKPVNYEHEYIGKRNYKNLEPKLSDVSKISNSDKISYNLYEIEKNL